VFIPFHSSYGVSVNVKAVKLAEDLAFVYKDAKDKLIIKNRILTGKIAEDVGMDTLRTSVNFSAIKGFVAPILPHNLQSKIVNMVFMRTNATGGGQFQNMMLLIVAALGAIILGGFVIRLVF
jgi:hypothetical protein